MNRPTQYTAGRRISTRTGPSVAHGVFDSQYPNTIARSQVSKSVNFYMTPDGILETRGGTQKGTDTAVAVTGARPELHEFVKRETDGSLTRKTMLKSGTVLYEYNPSTGVFVSKQTGLSEDKASMINFVNHVNAEIMLYADGSKFLMYDGSTVTDIGSKFTAGAATGIPRYLLAKWNVVFAAGDDSNPDTVFYCDPQDPNDSDWPLSGFLLLEGGVDKITGLSEIGDFVVVAALNSMHIITGRTAATFAPIKVSSQVGCSSHWSLVPHSGFIYWANPSGFYSGRLKALQDEGMDVEYCSYGMQNTYSGKAAGSEADIEGVYHEGLQTIFWSVKTDGADSPDKLFAYSTSRSHPELPSPEYGSDLRFVWSGYYTGTESTITTGTVAVTNGSTTVTSKDSAGSNAQNFGSVIAGNSFQVGVESATYVVASVSTGANPHTLVLTAAYAGTTNTAASYTITRDIIDFSSVGILRDSNGVAELYAASSDGFVYKFHTGYKDVRQVGADSGTDIAYEIRSREETYGGIVRIAEFLPTLYQKHNSGFNVQFMVDRAELFPANPANITFRGRVPYWHDGSDPGVASRWGSTIWTEKPIIAARIVLKKKCSSIIAIIKSDGSNAQEEGTWIGYDIKHQNISQKQGKSA